MVNLSLLLKKYLLIKFIGFKSEYAITLSLIKIIILFINASCSLVNVFCIFDILFHNFDNCRLLVDDNYLVPSIDGGLVVFIGKKDNYNNCVIVEQSDGVNVLYGNLSNINVKLYDYIDKGSLIGNCNNELYLVFSKDGNNLNYDKKI